MVEDLFDDAAFRHALASALGLRAVPFGAGDLPGQAVGEATPVGWAFERRRAGLRQLELAPLGLYTPLDGSGPRRQALESFIDEAPRRVARVTIHLNPLEPDAELLAQRALERGYRGVTHETHLLALGQPTELLRQGYHATKRAQVRRDVRLRQQIVVAREPRQLDDYFEAYGASLARWGRGGPLYPRALFEALLASPVVQLWMNYVEGRLACAMVVFSCRRYAFYWQGVSRIDEDQKAAFPMVRLMDAVLQHLLERGIPQFNLGASDGLPNVRRFKEEFGARPRAYTTLIHESALWRMLDVGRRLWRKRAP